MSDTIIQVENLGKQYLIRHERKEPYTALRDVIANRAKSFGTNLIRGRSQKVKKSNIEEFWALEDISFQVKRGDRVGIIGRNGAGKSTLLKILSRITEPTTGKIHIKGRVASLLEVGTGFHPELTGRENIYLNGAILGMSKIEIENKFDEIVAFAEVEKFLDTPVKRYSSGMHVRLAFAVAAHLEPEILIVDEVLAVGDVAFQKKCLGKMESVSKEGRTVLFVSHSMGTLTRLCEKAIWLNKGKLLAQGDSEDLVSKYLTSDASLAGEVSWPEGIANEGVTEFRLCAVRVISHQEEISSILDYRKHFYIEIEFEILKLLPFCRVGFTISTTDGTHVFQSYDTDLEASHGERQPGLFVSRCQIPGYLLSPKHFLISVRAGMIMVKNFIALDNILSFDIEDTGAFGHHVGAKRLGVIRPKLEWEQQTIN